MNSIIPSTMHRSSTPQDEIGCRASEVVGVVQFVEASSLEERVPPRPAQIARRDERRAISAIAKHGAERGPGEPRILFGDVVEIELRIGGQQHRHQRVRASADVRVEVVEHEAAGRLGREVRAWSRRGRRSGWPIGPRPIRARRGSRSAVDAAVAASRSSACILGERVSTGPRDRWADGGGPIGAKSLRSAAANGSPT